MSGLFTLHWGWFVAVVGMAAVTYATRIAGLVLMQGVEVKGRLKAALDAVPVSVMMAVITPDVFLHGWAEKITGAVVALAAWYRLPLVVNILIGMGCVVGLRHMLGG